MTEVTDRLIASFEKVPKVVDVSNTLDFIASIEAEKKRLKIMMEEHETEKKQQQAVEIEAKKEYEEAERGLNEIRIIFEKLTANHETKKQAYFDCLKQNRILEDRYYEIKKLQSELVDAQQRVEWERQKEERARLTESWHRLHDVEAKYAKELEMEKKREADKKLKALLAKYAGKRDAPLLEAAYAGNTEDVKHFISMGANVCTQDNDGMTALHWASLHHDDPEIPALLLSQPNAMSLLNSHGPKKITPLHMAAQFNRSKIIRFLLEKGANYEIKRNDGWTPFMVAKRSRFEDSVAVFKEFGATIKLSAS